MITLYSRQINHIFNRPITQPEWYWSDHWEEGVFEENPLSAFTFIETLLLNVQADLSPYSNDQIALGLDYVFNNSISNVSCGFKEAAVPFERKEAALRSLFSLFRDVFNPRCEAKTSAHSQETQSRLNSVCYMFWDVCPWSTWLDLGNVPGLATSFLAELSDEFLENMGLPPESLDMMRKQIAEAKANPQPPVDIMEYMESQHKNMGAETKGYYEAIADVMQRCLELSNPACVESGLHGLGHLAAFQPKIAVPIIDEYLKNGKNRSEALVDYAKSARTGMIL